MGVYLRVWSKVFHYKHTQSRSTFYKCTNRKQRNHFSWNTILNTVTDYCHWFLGPIPFKLTCDNAFKDDFEVPRVPYMNWKTYDNGVIANWVGSSGTVELWSKGFNGVIPPGGSQIMELQSTGMDSLSTTLQVSPGNILEYSFFHRGRSGVDEMELYIGKPKTSGKKQNNIINFNFF